MNTLRIELHYLPCLDYVAGVGQFGMVQLEAHEHYQKQTYRNRCYVLGPNGIECLTVPVLAKNQQPVRDVRIDPVQPWAGRHWRALRTAYGRAPFFEHYGPLLEPVFRRSWTYLFDLNLELLTICLQRLGVKSRLELTECYEDNVATGVLDARSQINRRKDNVAPLFYTPRPYAQNFGREFVPNLSILDALFCQGPEARHYVL